MATLAALAVVGRLAFAAIPNVKPTTDIVLFAGYALGAIPGFVVGAVTALASNVFLSQGPWTPWQMAGWGAVGVAGALVARAMRGGEVNRFALAAVCGLAGLAFGAWMDLYQLMLAARQDMDTYLAISAASLPYNLAHAFGNIVFCLLIGPVFIRALRRYRRRLEVSWRASAAVTGAALALLVLPAAAGAASPAEKAERWLLRSQNEDGGFGAAKGASSGALFSGWSALGLAAAGNNPRDVSRPGGRSLAAYVAGGTAKDVGEIERTALVRAAAGLPTRRLAQTISGRRRANGSIAGFVSYTAFGVLALRAAGAPAGGSTVSWLVSAQNDDGGFGVAPASASESDMTGAVLQALAAVGRARRAAARSAVAWLRSNQNSDGGFGQLAGRASNAQSTSYAVQGLVAAGAGGASLTRALAYLRGLQRPDGSVAYSASSNQTPVWVTAQALLALAREPLPLAEVPRAPREPRETEASAAPAPPAAPPAASPAPASPAGSGSSAAPADSGSSAAPADAAPAPARGAAGDEGSDAAPVPRAGDPPIASGPQAEEPTFGTTAPPDDTLRLDRPEPQEGGVSVALLAAIASAIALVAVVLLQSPEVRRRLLPHRPRHQPVHEPVGQDGGGGGA